MGILDDAIRQHLELKRKHGAESSDLERLEKEAFGPATRPGDPEFATGEAPASAQPDQRAGAATEAADPPSEVADSGVDIPVWLTGEEETTVAPSTPQREPASDELPAPAAEEPPSTHDPASEGEPSVPPEGAVQDEDQPEGAAGASSQRPTQLGPADEAEAPPDVQPPSGEPGDPASGGPASTEPAAVEHELPVELEPPEAPERGIFDAEDLDFGDLDLELDDDGDDDEELEDVPFADPGPTTLEPEPPARESSGSRRAAAAPETDPDLPPAPVEPRRPEPPAETPVPAVQDPADPDSDDEDLLEETPDFLQEAPEGEDLWFEQGPPRDFDFDDD